MQRLVVACRGAAVAHRNCNARRNKKRSDRRRCWHAFGGALTSGCTRGETRANRNCSLSLSRTARQVSRARVEEPAQLRHNVVASSTATANSSGQRRPHRLAIARIVPDTTGSLRAPSFNSSTRESASCERYVTDLGKPKWRWAAACRSARERASTSLLVACNCSERLFSQLIHFCRAPPAT